MKKALFIATLALFSVLSCTKKEVPADETLLGKEYYPTQKGRYVVYDVDSIIYGILPRDTIVYKYRIKERLAEEFTDGLGKPAIKIERFIKKYDPAKTYDELPWTMKEVWMVNADDQRVQVVESNIRFTKLIFPVQDKASWDGNAANNQGERSYTYNYIDRTETINGNKLDKVLMVRQKEYRTLISYENRVEKYAKGVGLVYREIKDLLSNNIIQNLAVEDRIESGIVYKQTLVTYGTE